MKPKVEVKNQKVNLGEEAAKMPEAQLKINLVAVHGESRVSDNSAKQISMEQLKQIHLQEDPREEQKVENDQENDDNDSSSDRTVNFEELQDAENNLYLNELIEKRAKEAQDTLNAHLFTAIKAQFSTDMNKQGESGSNLSSGIKNSRPNEVLET